MQAHPVMMIVLTRSEQPMAYSQQRFAEKSRGFRSLIATHLSLPKRAFVHSF